MLCVNTVYKSSPMHILTQLICFVYTVDLSNAAARPNPLYNTQSSLQRDLLDLNALDGSSQVSPLPNYETSTNHFMWQPTIDDLPNDNILQENFYPNNTGSCSSILLSLSYAYCITSCADNWPLLFVIYYKLI